VANFISEDQIEVAVVKVLAERLGYNTLNCYTADPEDLNDGSQRSSKQDVVFEHVLKAKAVELNPGVPEAAIDQALARLTHRRAAMSSVQANRESYHLVRDGITVEYEGAKGHTEHAEVKVIDFGQANRNDFLAVRQLWIKGERYWRRPDVILYVNGLPLVFIELKNSNVKVRNAYDDNLSNYNRDIPQLFQFNAFCVLSNAIETKVGAFNAGWEYFFNWFRPDDETEKINPEAIQQEGTSLERAVLGLCPRERLLDYVENFILFHKDSTKIVAQNHQFIGVNKAVDSFDQREQKTGKLGVFWHTQGSGKSFSMIFLTRKISRKFTGNYTFVIVTDRDSLDGQIYRNFLHTETISKKEQAQPKNSDELREFLGRNKRFVFTLIHKFRYPKGKAYPLLSDRDDIIVIVDEAHRTQYKSLAENMRAGLPKAQYYAFTGTPLLGRERKTNAWFGDYVSEYNFTQSTDDGATVPLFYQKRVPEVLIQNENLSQEFYEILEDENLDEVQQEKLEKEFSTEMEVIKRDDRLDRIAQDIVEHFPRRGFLGKGMVVTVDKFTAVKMYNKVDMLWKQAMRDLVLQIRQSKLVDEKAKLQKTLDFMRRVDMAVIVSEEAGEIKKFRDQDLDIRPHREVMSELDKNGHDIEYRFKDPEDRLQLVFVCAMWLTGFDAPTVSTLYLDKPMKDHTLMQAIARANRVTSYTINDVIKNNGEIIDYYNVFRNMKKALAAYAQGSDDEKPPVQEKDVLFTLLDDALQQGQEFCQALDIDLNSVLDSGDVFQNIGSFQAFADKLLERDEFRKQYCVYENTITSLYEACKPEILMDKTRPLVPVFQYLRGVIDCLVKGVNVDQAKRRVSDLLDQSVVAPQDLAADSGKEAKFQIIQKGKSWDLSKINVDKLKESFQQTEYKNIEITDLRAFIESKLDAMLKQNATRTDFAQRFQAIVDNYNAGGSSNENYFDELLKFTEKLREEDERHIKEGLKPDELELFDIIKKDRMTQDEKKRVKLAAKALLRRLLEKHPKLLVQDWYKDSQTQAQVKNAVEEVLHKELPESYDRVLFKNTCEKAYELIYEYASKGGKWAA
jgi:type I restriction enzyme, R subunit